MFPVKSYVIMFPDVFLEFGPNSVLYDLYLAGAELIHDDGAGYGRCKRATVVYSCLLLN